MQRYYEIIDELMGGLWHTESQRETYIGQMHGDVKETINNLRRVSAIVLGKWTFDDKLKARESYMSFEQWLTRLSLLEYDKLYDYNANWHPIEHMLFQIALKRQYVLETGEDFWALAQRMLNDIEHEIMDSKDYALYVLLESMINPMNTDRSFKGLKNAYETYIYRLVHEYDVDVPYLWDLDKTGELDWDTKILDQWKCIVDSVRAHRLPVVSERYTQLLRRITRPCVFIKEQDKKIKPYAKMYNDTLYVVDHVYITGLNNVQYTVYNNADNTTGTCFWHAIGVICGMSVEEMAEHMLYAIDTPFKRKMHEHNLISQPNTPPSKYTTISCRSPVKTPDIPSVRYQREIVDRIYKRVEDGFGLNDTMAITLLLATRPDIAIVMFHMHSNMYTYEQIAMGVADRGWEQMWPNGVIGPYDKTMDTRPQIIYGADREDIKYVGFVVSYSWTSEEGKDVYHVDVMSLDSEPFDPYTWVQDKELVEDMFEWF